MKTYTAGAVSESSFLKNGSMDQEVLCGKKWNWVPETERYGEKGEIKEDRREHFNKYSFVVLVWKGTKRKEIMRTSITCLT